MRPLSFVLVLLLQFSLIAQPAAQRMSQAEYIELFKDEAIREMKRSGVPASITLAQGILESGNGNSALARKANNHFGIKCHSDWDGKTYTQDDDKKNECFRKYNDVLDSYKDHSDFLRKPRYADLFELKITDYKGWAHGLKKAGYATNPKYPRLLIDIIEKNDLGRFDKQYSGREDRVARKRDNSSREASRSAKNTTTNSSAIRVKMHENNIKYIDPTEEDDLEDLAHEFNMAPWQFYKYNDIEEGDPLPEDILYLQPKRGRAQVDFHTLQEGESLWDVSQKYGIKLKKIYRRNRLDEGAKVKVGTKLYLRGKKPR